MSSKASLFLAKALGEDFMESLAKVELWKPGTRTTLDHEEIKTALKIVPRTIMAILVRDLVPMGVGESKEIQLPIPAGQGAGSTDAQHQAVNSGAQLKVTKHERDVYSGELIENNQKVVDFKYRSLPGIGLVIMTAFELYDIHQINQPAPEEMQPDVNAKIERLIDERIALHNLVEQVVEKKLSQRDALQQAILSKISHDLRAAKDEAEQARVQLAGAGVAAFGYAKDVKAGDYGHSASLEDVKKLYDEHAKVKKDIVEITKVSEDSTPNPSEYHRGMTNGLKVAESVVTGQEPEFLDAPKVPKPLKKFLDERKKKLQKNEFSIEMVKGETVHCPDCGNSLIDGQVFTGCICLGDDMDKKVFIKKTEDGVKVRFSKDWDKENIEMLLEVLRKRRA